MKNEKNLEFTCRFDKAYPGPHSNLRANLQLTPTKVFIIRGKGGRVWDVDGNEYIDFLNAAGPTLLGHGHPEFVQALKNHLETMAPSIGTGILCTPIDVEVAEKIERYVPCAEKIKFCVSGTEAVQMAIRLARAYTKRPLFIRFEGHYHGWSDNVLGGALDEEAIQAFRKRKGNLRKPFGRQSMNDVGGTEGREPGAFEQSLLLPWNDPEVLEAVLEQYGDEVAMIHMEPILVNHGCLPPLPGYLEKIRELCTRYGIVMSFDEVITGFRVGLGGAQAQLGVTPDLATFGKAIASGLPLSAVAGKQEILNLLQDGTVLSPGTFNGYPLGLAGSLATISILEKDHGAIYREIDRLQKRLMEGLKGISFRRGIPFLIQGPRGVFVMWPVDKQAAYTEQDLSGLNWALLEKFVGLLAQEGVLTMFIGRWYISAGLTDRDVDHALEAADRAMAKL